MQDKNVKYAVLEDEYFAAHELVLMMSHLRSNYTLSGIAEDYQGIHEVLAQKPELIIADVNLCDCQSPTALKDLQCDIPVIFCTGFAQTQRLTSSLNTSGFLLKPIRESELAESLCCFEAKEFHLLKK